jgi:3-methyladenine DNA glycosylase AlkD
LSNLKDLKIDIKKEENPEKARILSKFFRTGPGEYGEGDKFLGITVPIQRQLAQKHGNITLADIEILVKSPLHEERLIGLLILVQKFEEALTEESTSNANRIIYTYLQHTDYINNWDLVDLTASKILGHWLFDKDRKQLHTLAKSKKLWEKRIAIISTYYFIKRGDFGDTIAIAKILLHDTHDLIHKAVGWMLREVGKQDLATLDKFLHDYAQDMPRTMLRYAIEKHPEHIRQEYLKESK